MDRDPKQLLGEAMELVKRAQQLATPLSSAELGESLRSLREKLVDVREVVLELRETHQELRERVEELQESVALKPELVRHKGVYWAKDDPDPWCPTCWEADHKAVHLNRTDLLAGRLCSCRRCQYSVNLDNVSPPKPWPRSP